VRVFVLSNYFPPRELGGYELTCAAFARHLLAHGHAVRVLSADHPVTRPERPENATIDVRPLLRWRGPQAGPGGLRAVREDRRDLALLRDQLDDFAPDVVTVWGMSGVSRALLPALRDVTAPVSARISDGWLERRLEYRPAATRARVSEALRRRLGVPTDGPVGHVDRWVFNSAYMRDRAIALGVPRRRTAVVPSGIDVVAAGEPARAPWEGRLLYLGRIEEQKGVDTAVRAAAATGTTLRIVGDGEPDATAGLDALIAELGADVSRTPAVDRDGVARELAAADALLFPSRWAEPWGKVPLEAMAAGVPVIASGTGGSAEYLRDGDNALVVPADDDACWAAAIERLATDQALRERLTAQGRETAAGYSEAATSEKLERELVHAVAA
jgi:glycogen synthase